MSMADENANANWPSTAMARLAHLLQFSDSTLPVGAFAFSQGLESALQLGVVTDAGSLKNYLALILRQAAHMDCIALLHAHRAACRGDYEGIREADHALWARRVGEEQQLMLARMGKKFAELTLAIMPVPLLERWLADVNGGTMPGCFPVAQAIGFASLQIDEAEAFVMHQYGLSSMILNAALRLMRIDHLTTQKLLFESQAVADRHYESVRALDLDEMSGFAPVYDVIVAHHTRTHLRLFMN
jgi:urease accessory protein